MEAKNNKARIETGRKELLQMWYSSALDIMDSMLEDFEYTFKGHAGSKTSNNGK